MCRVFRWYRYGSTKACTRRRARDYCVPKTVNVDTAVQQLKYEGFLASGFPCDVDREEDRWALLKYVKRSFDV